LSQQACPKCNCDLSVLQALEVLKVSVRQAQSDSQGVASRLYELEQQVASLEPQIVTQLTSQPGAASEPTAPPQPGAAPQPVAPSETVAPPESSTPSEPTIASLLEPLPEPDAPGWSAPPDGPIASETTNTPTGNADPTAPPIPPSQAPATSTAHDWPPILSRTAELRLGQKWLLIAGVVALVLAVGYFLKYSFDRNWIGPAGRVSLAYLAGIATLATGEFCRRKNYEVFGLYLFGGGIAVLYFASYAAFQIYSLIGQMPAFGLMACVTALAGFFSLKYDTRWLAVLGIIGGFFTPVVLSTGTDNQIALMTYMAILNGGILAIAAFKQWHLLNYLGLAFTWLLFTTWYAHHYADEKFWTTTVFLNLFFLIYAIVPYADCFVRKNLQLMAGLGITIPNTYVAFGFSFGTIYNHASVEWVSIATTVYAALFLGMAAYVRRHNRENVDAFILLLAKGFLFLIITVPILFSEHWITIFWAAQAIALLWVAIKLSDVRLRYGAMVLLLIAAGKLFFYDYLMVFDLQIPSMVYGDGFLASILERWITVILTLTIVFRTGQMLKRADGDRDDWLESPATLFVGLFGLMLFLAMNLEVAAFFGQYVPVARFASISVLWAIFATSLMILGFVRNQELLRGCSILLYAVTILKVFLRDMANVDTPYRILSFLVLGLLLVGASYLYHRFKDRILPGEEDTETSESNTAPIPPVGA
jgi:uncharacterized membrane protein